MQGLFQACFGSFWSQDGAIVVDAIRDEWPAKIQALAADVDFVATPRAVFMRPDFTRYRMHRHPLGIAVAIGEDGFHFSGLSYKRIIRRYRTVIFDAVNFTPVVAQQLRTL